MENKWEARCPDCDKLLRYENEEEGEVEIASEHGDRGTCEECMRAECDNGPQEEDLITSDRKEVYSYGGPGKLAFTTTPDTFEADCRAYMERTKFFPNVWFISDHGNAHLINFSVHKGY